MPEADTALNPANVTLDAEALLAWYDRHARPLPWRVLPGARKRGIAPDPYRVWLSEIMLQQTTVAAVTDYFVRFLRRWPKVEDLAAAPLDDVLSEWAGLGYYARARNMHAAAKTVSTELHGSFPNSAETLMKLPGVGPYTAAAIAAICFDEKIAVLDGNVERVMARIMALSVPVREAKPLLRQAVQQNVPARSGDFAQAMMDLGATLCAPRATTCMLCPLSGDCAGAATGQPTDFPLKSVKAEKPIRYGHAFVVTRSDGAVWLRKRPEKGLLAQMTEVPVSAWESEVYAPQYPLPGKWRNAGLVTHVFTHFRLELQVWHLASDTQPSPDGWWSAPEDHETEALPSLFRKVLTAAID